MKGVIKKKNIKFIKKCLISPITEIIMNVMYIISFLTMYIFFISEGESFNNFQINEIAKNYLNYEQFSSIKNSSDFESYLQMLLNKLYIIDSSKDPLPILIPLGPIRLSHFLNDVNNCNKNLNYSKHCNFNFTCIIDSLTDIYNYNCEENNSNNNENNTNQKFEIKFSGIVPKLNGFYSKYDIINNDIFIDITISNYNNDSSLFVQNLINDQNLKLLLLQINFKLRSNDNYVDIIIGIEMLNYFRNIKRIFNVFVFKDISSNNTIIFVFAIFFYISVALEIIKLIYEINVKLIWSVHTFIFINLLVSIVFIVFNIMELYVNKNINLSINLNIFNTHLPYIYIKKYNKMLYSILLIFLPFRIISLLSWRKSISEPLIKVLNIFFRMFPGILLTILLFFIFCFSFIFVNYFLFKDIFPQFQSLFDSFLFIFQSDKIKALLNYKNSLRLYHNLSFSQYIIFFIFFEIFLIYISFIILISTFVFLFKKANIIEMPKVENEYISKLKQIEEKLEKRESLEDTDLQKLPKQILWINLNTKSNIFKTYTSKYDLLLFKNSNQVISFIKYLLAVKPELQFQKLYKKFIIIIQLNDFINENDFDIIYYLADWLIFVGCTIPICIYSETAISNSFRMRLLKAYKYIYFINNESQLEKFISQKYGKDKLIINSNFFNFISVKNIIVEENDNDDESDTTLLKVGKASQSVNKFNYRIRHGKRMPFGAQRTLIPYSTLNLRNSNE